MSFRAILLDEVRFFVPCVAIATANAYSVSILIKPTSDLRHNETAVGLTGLSMILPNARQSKANCSSSEVIVFRLGSLSPALHSHSNESGIDWEDRQPLIGGRANKTVSI